jgi:hypothetical protein
MNETWHGLSNRQWRELWSMANWQAVASAALERIAMCREAHISDRLTALMMLNHGASRGLLNPMTFVAPFPVFARDVLLSIAAGSRPARWWHWRKRRTAARCAEQIEAIKFLLNMSDVFMKENPIEVVNAPVGFTGVHKGLPS